MISKEFFSSGLALLLLDAGFGIPYNDVSGVIKNLPKDHLEVLGKQDESDSDIKPHIATVWFDPSVWRLEVKNDCDGLDKLKSVVQDFAVSNEKGLKIQ
jgi:hypothetical protein